ncbi:MAG: tryptophan--tRNA ligase, partial [Candidatus Bathyarchaeota archaeon]|nr:tryptophan--tRNA ligase [Candidatus Bathyarchaeota archaeon]
MSLGSDADKAEVIRLDPFGASSIMDYDRLCKEFGIQLFKTLLARVPNPTAAMRRGVLFGHRDFGLILDAMRDGEQFAVMSGIKPNEEFHLGSLMTAREIVHYQQQGATAFYCIADVESYEDNGTPFEESEKTAVGNVADLLALGFDPERGYIYRQSQEERVKDLAIDFARGIPLATMKAIYGERHMGLYLSALIQAGDILLPQLREFGGPRPTIVPVGIDQDPHIRLTRDLVPKFREQYGFIAPSSTYHKIIKALDGGPKMSKRSPMSYFTLAERPEVVAGKIADAYTGGRPTATEQRKLGANPDICPIYEMCLFHFYERDDDIVELRGEC